MDDASSIGQSYSLAKSPAAFLMFSSLSPLLDPMAIYTVFMTVFPLL